MTRKLLAGKSRGVLVWVGALVFTTAQAAPPQRRRAPPTPIATAFALRSPAFSEGGRIPAPFTSEGRGISPPLEWSGIPKNTRELVLVVEDIDMPHGPFTHWIIYGISPQVDNLPQAIPPSVDKLYKPLAALQGANSQGTLGYTAPHPLPGDPAHHYQFRLFALNREVALGPGLGRHEILSTIQRSVIEEADLMGLCQHK